MKGDDIFRACDRQCRKRDTEQYVAEYKQIGNGWLNFSAGFNAVVLKTEELIRLELPNR